MNARRSKTLRTLLTLGMILVMLVVSACSGTGTKDSGGDTSPAETSQPPAPQEGGTVVWATGSDATNLDPGYAYSDEDIMPILHMYETLVTYGESSDDIRPGLATEWTVSDDGTVWTFQLRQGVKFHDGTPFTSEAVVRSLKRLYDENDKYYQKDQYAYFTDLFGDVIQEIIPVSEYEVQFVLARPFAPFLAYMAYYSQAIVSPKALEEYGADFYQHPVGTGKFKLESWQPGDRLTLVRNPDYWGEQAALDSIIFRVVPDATTRLFEMEQGNVHVYAQPSVDQLPRIKSNPNLQIISRQGASIMYVAINHQKPPLDNKLVRQAIAHGVNWQQIVDTVWGETGKRANSPVPEGVLGHDPSLPAYEYDPELAKSLLAQAGLNNVEIDMLAPGVPRWSQPDPLTSLEMVQSDLAKIGVKLNPMPMDYSAVSSAMKSGDYHLSWQGWKDVPDPNNFLNAMVVGWGKSIWRYDLPMLPELATQGTSTDRKEEREQVYREMQRLLADDVTLIPVAYGRDVLIVPKSLEGVYFGPDGSPRLLSAHFVK